MSRAKILISSSSGYLPAVTSPAPGLPSWVVHVLSSLEHTLACSLIYDANSYPHVIHNFFSLYSPLYTSKLYFCVFCEGVKFLHCILGLAVRYRLQVNGCTRLCDEVICRYPVKVLS